MNELFQLDFGQLSFANPWAGLLWLLTIPLILQFMRGRLQKTLLFSSTKILRDLPKSPRSVAPYVFFVFKLLILSLLIIAAARPQKGNSTSERSSEGLDIVLAIDTSGSMRALDLKLNDTRYDRLTVVKNVLLDFIKKRRDDRIGMVVFGSEAYTQAPLTLDHDVLLEFLGQLEIEMAGPQTAIGDAIATATNRLKPLESKSKIIILLTDGENTAGVVEPTEAAQAASTFGIKIYTIGVGSNGMAPFPVQGFFGQSIRNMEVKIDTELLNKIANITGGKAFLAQDTEALRRVYDEIDQLEKTEIEVTEFMNYEEAANWFLWPALVLIFLDAALSLSRLRTIP